MRIARFTGAGGVAHVPVGRDRGQVDRLTCLVLLGRAEGEGGRPGRTRRPRPGQEPSGQAPDGVELTARGGDRGVIAHHGDAQGPGVGAVGVRSHDHSAARRAQRARAPFEDLAVLVDQVVVADVPPAQRDRVVVVDAAHDGGGLSGGVVVGARGVVNHDVLGRGVTGLPGQQCRVGPPLGPAGDRHRREVGRPGLGEDRRTRPADGVSAG